MGNQITEESEALLIMTADECLNIEEIYLTGNSVDGCESI